MKSIYVVLMVALSAALMPACDRTGKGSEGTQSGTDRPAGDRAVSPGVVARRLETGNEIAGLAKNALAQKLKSAIVEGGVEHAIQFCKINAYPILDSVQEATGATIRRVTFKTRNPQDAPDELEAGILRQYHEVHASGTTPKAKITTVPGGQLLYTKPIVVDNALCLMCHGSAGEELTAQNHRIIAQHYPEDEATGYSLGDLRGMWSIRMPGGEYGEGP